MAYTTSPLFNSALRVAGLQYLTTPTDGGIRLRSGPAAVARAAPHVAGPPSVVAAAALEPKWDARYAGHVPHDTNYYMKCMLGGILSCGLTHTAVTPYVLIASFLLCVRASFCEYLLRGCFDGGAVVVWLHPRLPECLLADYFVTCPSWPAFHLMRICISPSVLTMSSATCR